jgi:hypothetical protein
MSDRAEKATRLAVAGAISAVPGLWGVVTGTVWLGYLAVGILLVAILLGPVIERIRAQGA